MEEPHRAFDLLRECTATFNESNAIEGLAFALDAFAAVFVQTGDAQCAATLMGAVDSIRTDFKMPIRQSEREAYDRQLASVKSALNAQEFEECWMKGKSFSSKDATDLAMSKELHDGARGEKERAF